MSTKAYYDGLCPLCSREIEHYRRQKGSESLRFVDITSKEFNAAAEALDPFLVHRKMHVKRPDGSIIAGVDAFIEIWEHLPRYHWAAKASRNKLIKPLLNIGYAVFALIRPLLPRKKNNCEDSPYCETNR